MNQISEKDTYVLIMAGGVGSRFWPKSRNSFPKQFIDILGIGKSLLQLTYERFLHICPSENIFILSNAQYSQLVFEQIPLLQKDNIIAEPSRNNTAPCIAYASFKIKQINPNARIVVAPSDHLILNEDVFLEKVAKALDFVRDNDALVTLGITPTRPDTGYGYINYKNSEFVGINRVTQFHEKPDIEKAKQFIDDGNYLWNAGIFVWRVDVILTALNTYANDIYNLFEKGSAFYNTAAETGFIDANYPLSDNISIDYAIMEKAQNVFTIPGEFGWSDLGTWASLYEVVDKDEQQNVFSGHSINYSDTSNCMIQIPKNKIAVIKGLHNFIVVDDGKVLLIYPKEFEQEIKDVSKAIVSTAGSEFA